MTTTARIDPRDHAAEVEPPGSEGERSEPERPGGFTSAGRSVHPPDPEVQDRPRRRKFTAAYKRLILAEIDSATGQGQVGAILRREGLYSSHIATWRKTRDDGPADRARAKEACEIMSGHQRGVRLDFVDMSRLLR